METHTFTETNLIAGEFPRVEEKGTIASGAGNLTEGAVLAKDGAGKLVLVDSSQPAPANEVYAILAQDADASSADVEAIVYLAGQFNTEALAFGGADTLADHESQMRKIGLFTATNLGA